jgi:hypothetical protein
MDTKTIQEVSALVGALGGLLLALAGLTMVLANRSYTGPTPAQRQREKWAHLLGGLLIGAGFVGLLVVTLKRG